MSPEPFDSRAEDLPAKRWEKGYGDENELTPWDKPTKWQTSRTILLYSRFQFLCFRFLSPLTAEAVPLPSFQHDVNFSWTSECSSSPSNKSSSSLGISERPAMVRGNINVVTRRHHKLLRVYLPSPSNISYADRDDSHILRKSQYTALIRLLIRDH